MSVRKYDDLIVWQKAMELCRMVYHVSGEFPSDERFGLTSQVRRAAVSIPSNIAEGQGRNTTGEFIQFLGTARGSLHEVETQLLLARNLNFITPDQAEPALNTATEVAKLINALVRSLKARGSG